MSTKQLTKSIRCGATSAGVSKDGFMPSIGARADRSGPSSASVAKADLGDHDEGRARYSLKREQAKVADDDDPWGVDLLGSFIAVEPADGGSAPPATPKRSPRGKSGKAE